MGQESRLPSACMQLDMASWLPTPSRQGRHSPLEVAAVDNPCYEPLGPSIDPLGRVDSAIEDTVVADPQPMPRRSSSEGLMSRLASPAARAASASRIRPSPSPEPTRRGSRSARRDRTMPRTRQARRPPNPGFVRSRGRWRKDRTVAATIRPATPTVCFFAEKIVLTGSRPRPRMRPGTPSNPASCSVRTYLAVRRQPPVEPDDGPFWRGSVTASPVPNDPWRRLVTDERGCSFWPEDPRSAGRLIRARAGNCSDHPP